MLLLQPSEQRMNTNLALGAMSRSTHALSLQVRWAASAAEGTAAAAALVLAVLATDTAYAGLLDFALPLRPRKTELVQLSNLASTTYTNAARQLRVSKDAGS